MSLKKLIMRLSANEAGAFFINPLKIITSEYHKAIFPPWNDKPIGAIIAKRLSYAEIQSAGSFSLIKTFEDEMKDDSKKVTFSEMTDYCKIQYGIIKQSLISPTYDELYALCARGVDIESIKKQMENIQELFDNEKDQKMKNQFDEEYSALEMRLFYCLPNDFIAYVFSFAVGSDESDIDKINEEILYNCAVKAKLGNDNPADHIDGRFSKFNYEDINDRSWVEYFKKQKGYSNKFDPVDKLNKGL